MKNIEELFKAALEYHLKKIEEEMQEAVNQGRLHIAYKIPKVLLEDQNFRKCLSSNLSEAGYTISKYPSDENFFKIACIEIIEDNDFKEKSNFIELEHYKKVEEKNKEDN